LLGTTFGGNHLACAAALAVLEVIAAEDLMTLAHTNGEYIMGVLRAIPGVLEVRGKGLMIGIQLDQPAAGIRKQLFEEYRMLTGNASDPNVIRLLPPLNVQRAHLDQFAAALKNILHP
jgi:acetylornithine aminotransferase